MARTIYTTDKKSGNNVAETFKAQHVDGGYPPSETIAGQLRTLCAATRQTHELLLLHIRETDARFARLESTPAKAPAKAPAKRKAPAKAKTRKDTRPDSPAGLYILRSHVDGESRATVKASGETYGLATFTGKGCAKAARVWVRANFYIAGTIDVRKAATHKRNVREYAGR